MSKPRKSQHYPAEIATLIRAAQPLPAEIEGESDPDKRQKRQRECEIATDELIRISRDQKLFNQLSQERQFEVKWFIEDLKRQSRRTVRSRGKFPVRKGGRPRDDHRRLLIAVKMAGLVDGGATVHKAIKLVRQWQFGKSIAPATVKDIHFDKDPEWQRLVRVELARRAYEASVEEDALRAPLRTRQHAARLEKPKRKAVVI